MPVPPPPPVEGPCAVVASGVDVAAPGNSVTAVTAGIFICGTGLGGSTAGFGGGAYREGNGVTSPVLIHETKPNYTGEAMRARIQGLVKLEAIVMPDGSVGDVRVVHSLDQQFGLDKEAIKTLRQWRFKPGMRLGQPVPVLILVEISFTLR